MHPLRMTLFSTGLTFAMFLAHAASAQITTQMKATAMEKMMPADKDARVRKADAATED